MLFSCFCAWVRKGGGAWGGREGVPGFSGFSMRQLVTAAAVAVLASLFSVTIVWVFWRRQQRYNSSPLPGRSWQGHNTMLMAPHGTASTIFIDDLIPLGPSCLAAYHFRRGGWRKTSLPFDWTLFDDRQQHIPELAKLVDNKFAPLLSLEQDTSALRRFEESSDGHANTFIVHSDIPTMRWLHDDPLRNASTVVRRTQRLLRILMASSRRIVFTLAYGNVNELPSPLDLFLTQLQDLAGALETSFPNMTGHFRILIIVETLQSNPAYRALASQLEKKMPRRFIVASVSPLSENAKRDLTAEESRWGNAAAWTALMRADFRRYTRNNETLQTCLQRFSITPYRHPKGFEGPFTRYGYFVCRYSASSQGEFDRLDVNKDGALSRAEITALTTTVEGGEQESEKERRSSSSGGSSSGLL